jgi:2-keto-3-deoxy-L-rhamnonate aldolase RhmA
VLLNYQPVPVDQAAEILNREIMVICMIESAEGLDNIEKIAAVDGVDVLHMGVNDLLMDLGLPGKFGCPEALEAVERLLKACAVHGKFAGLGGDRHPERQRQFIGSGGRFLTTDSDLGFLRAEATRRTEALRAG